MIPYDINPRICQNPAWEKWGYVKQNSAKEYSVVLYGDAWEFFTFRFLSLVFFLLYTLYTV